MKRKYTPPRTQVIAMMTQQMIALSGVFSDETITDPDDIGSRGTDFADDDDD